MNSFLQNSALFIHDNSSLNYTSEATKFLESSFERRFSQNITRLVTSTSWLWLTRALQVSINMTPPPLLLWRFSCEFAVGVSGIRVKLSHSPPLGRSEEGWCGVTRTGCVPWWASGEIPHVFKRNKQASAEVHGDHNCSPSGQRREVNLIWWLLVPEAACLLGLMRSQVVLTNWHHKLDLRITNS